MERPGGEGKGREEVETWEERNLMEEGAIRFREGNTSEREV